jgi:hypothetical protein
MKKMQEKSKIYNIHDKAPTPPQTKPYGWQTPISPPQISKLRRIKGFSENVGQLSLDVYVSHLNVSLLYMISEEVVYSLNMSHLFVEGWIYGYRDGTGVIAHEGKYLKTHSKISHGVHYLKNPRAVATYSTSVVDCTIENCF